MITFIEHGAWNREMEDRTWNIERGAWNIEHKTYIEHGKKCNRKLDLEKKTVAM
jgi:hypothetical protein